MVSGLLAAPSPAFVIVASFVPNDNPLGSRVTTSSLGVEAVCALKLGQGWSADARHITAPSVLSTFTARLIGPDRVATNCRRTGDPLGISLIVMIEGKLWPDGHLPTVVGQDDNTAVLLIFTHRSYGDYHFIPAVAI